MFICVSAAVCPYMTCSVLVLVICLQSLSRGEFSHHLPKHVRNFAAEGGHSLLWPEATTFLSHRGAYSRPEADIVACGQRPQGFMCQKSRLNPGHLVTLGIDGIEVDLSARRTFGAITNNHL